MSNQCKECQQLIDWNKIARDKLNTRRPLNPDGTIHSCSIGSRPSTKPIPPPNDYPNPITAIVASKKVAEPKLDLNNLNVIKVLVAALQEYVVIKEAGQ